MTSPPKKEAPSAWRQSGARLGSLEANVDNSRQACNRRQQQKAQQRRICDRGANTRADE